MTNGKEPKSAILIISNKKDKHFRVMVFDSHLEALDTGEHYRTAGYGWELIAFEHIALGQKIDDLPLIQKELL